jgi:hypothetical protein
MRLFHYLEIENFKRFGDKQHIVLDHPAVLIGPNNCGKTCALQAIALWSQAVKTWCDVRLNPSTKERPTKDKTASTASAATSLNRLAIVSVPVQRTRYFWHNTKVRVANEDIPLIITLGVWFEGELIPFSMRFRNQGDELVYCSPDDATRNNIALIKYVAGLNVELLYPMSGLDTEEPILQSGRIDVLLGQGRTAEVMRNLCLMVYKNNQEDWQRVTQLMKRLFDIDLGDPLETTRGAIELQYQQPNVKSVLDVSSAGRGFQQMLLIFSYLYSHKGSVLLVDEPDAHLEILRQRQVYVLLRDIATENRSQVVMVTHSEVILNEALDNNLTLLLNGRADDLAAKKEIKSTLKHFSAEHYIKARERGYVVYVEGSTDMDMLRALARRLQHPAATVWDERCNVFYVQDNFPIKTWESELQRVEGGFGSPPKEHFFALRSLLPALRGLAILDGDGKSKSEFQDGGLELVYWRRYETENYIVTPDVLRNFALSTCADVPLLFDHYREAVETILNELIQVQLFDDVADDFKAYQAAAPEVARLLWSSKTEHMKLSAFAEAFFQRLAQSLQEPVLLKKGEFHRLVEFVEPKQLAAEVNEKLDKLYTLFKDALPASGESA